MFAQEPENVYLWEKPDMGTLGCVNDMLRRDKENRELRKRSRERLSDTRRRLLDTRGERVSHGISAEQLTRIVSERQKRERIEKNIYFRSALLFLAVAAVISLLILVFILI